MIETRDIRVGALVVPYHLRTAPVNRWRRASQIITSHGGTTGIRWAQQIGDAVFEYPDDLVWITVEDMIYGD